MSEASSGSGSPQSSTGLSNRRSERDPVVTCACASPLKKKKKNTTKGTCADFCGFTFAKKIK